MGFLSFLKRGDANDSGDRSSARETGRGRSRGGAESVDDVQQLRIRARRRLIGAAVLVGVGIIVFPLLFETQPRPIPVDLPIDIPRKDGTAPLNIPAPVAQTAPTGQGGDQGRGIITETAEQVGADRAVPPPEAPPEQLAQHTPPPAVVPVPVPVQRAEPKPEQKPEPRVDTKPAPAAAPVEHKPERKPDPKPDTKPERKPDPKPDAKPDNTKVAAAKPDTRATDAARAQALLEGRAPAPAAADKKPDAAANGARFIVQVGAYADGKAAQDVRAKVERMGLKTYTQAVDTADGKRIRVRVGPFNSRDEADKVAAKVRGGGFSSAVLTL